MIRVYSRCNGGDYFEGENCPLDGWSSAESRELAVAAKKLVSSGMTPSIRALRDVGVSDAALKRAIVIDFGDEASAFEAISPHGYQLAEGWMPKRKFDRRFL